MTNNDFASVIKSAETENVYVLTNKDADIIRSFRSLPGNRSIKQERVNKIMQAFKNGEFIPPILVSVPKREITEGNHRYRAALKCLELGIPFTLRVYLYQDKDALGTARVINNTQKRWTANDRLRSYVFEGKESYIRLKNFMDAHSDIFKKTNDYKVSSALCLLAKNRTLNSMTSTFYSGNLIIKDHHLKFAEEILQELLHISDILGDTSPIDRGHSTGWIKARERLGMPISSFMQLLKKKAKTWVEPSDSAKAWFDMYLSIAGGF